MAEFKLIPHPDFDSVAVRNIRVAATRLDRSEFKLEFRLTGDVDRIALPVVEMPRFRDELWRTTCFELFIRAAGGDGYQELNFSPSASWASYRFDGHRSGSRRATVSREPIIATIRHPSVLIVDIYVAMPAFGVALEANFTAVIEELDGTKSYWALAHAPGPPDFHNRDCFIATLPAPDV